MNRIFCVSCGAKVEYGLTKPNFCHSCGGSLNGEAKPQESNASVQEPEDEVDIEQLKDGVTASVNMIRPITIGDLINTGGEPSAPRPKFKGPQGKELLQQIQNECATSRDNPTEVGE